MKKETNYQPKHIDYALVESTRPAMYRAMKYWGRKPHNIWADFIENYCPENGLVLDPFVGSGITAFEAAILNRKVIATDLNPLSSFFIKTLSSRFDKDKFTFSANSIIESIKNDDIYKEHYIKNNNTVYNFIWKSGSLISVRFRDENGVGIVDSPDERDIDNSIKMSSLQIPYWFPTDILPNNPSINLKFISDIGGNSFEYLWTRRNLYVLSKLFSLIQLQEQSVQDQLMLAFIHCLHLSSKMVVPRGEKGNRDFSGSWGRADYMIRNQSMEQNPLVLFQRSCFEDQGVVYAMENSKERLPQDVKFKYRETGKFSTSALVNYGILDVADITDYLAGESVDFIITDPPYGGLVQYMDLSQIWLVWLQKYNSIYKPDSVGEITYKKNIVSREEYSSKLKNAFKKLHFVLKNNHYMVVTFHSQDMTEWNEFISSIRLAGFDIEKVTHQYNKRSGESNVSNPYGTSGSDLYIRCVKRSHIDHVNASVELKQYIINTAVDILAKRCEPTEFEFISGPLLASMIQEGYMNPDAPAAELKRVLSEESGDGKIFQITTNEDGFKGDFYWFNDPSKYITHESIKLKDRVEVFVHQIIKREQSLKYDDIVAHVFKSFPDSLTPDPRSIKKIVKKFAKESNGKWKYNPTCEVDSSEHTQRIAQLMMLGKKAGFEVFIGRREQSEPIKGKRLGQFASYNTLKSILDGYNSFQLSRIEMIDCIWVKGNEISAIFEVENSTDFLSAVSRASNISKTIPKFMVVPDKREVELMNYKDPMFLSQFTDNNWVYLKYSDIAVMLASSKKTLSIDYILKLSNKLKDVEDVRG